MPDRIFDEPRLAGVDDQLDPDRSDLDVYLAIAAELGARSAVDIGCGTGTFACLLATFCGTIVFHADDTELTSRSTLRFRDRDELTTSLEHAGFRIDDVREAPDRPGMEHLFLASR